MKLLCSFEMDEPCVLGIEVICEGTLEFFAGYFPVLFRMSELGI
jgi:hypothetical protein